MLLLADRQLDHAFGKHGALADGCALIADKLVIDAHRARLDVTAGLSVRSREAGQNQCCLNAETGVQIGFGHIGSRQRQVDGAGLKSCRGRLLRLLCMFAAMNDGRDLGGEDFLRLVDLRAAQRFQASGVDTVFSLLSALSYPTFVGAAAAVGFDPQWLSSDFENQVFNSTAKFMESVAASYDGAIGATYGIDAPTADDYGTECNAKFTAVTGITYEYGTEGDVLDAPLLIEKKARDMLRHYLEVVLPEGYKAQVVAASRRAAIIYREKLLAARDELAREIEALPAATTCAL